MLFSYRRARVGLVARGEIHGQDESWPRHLVLALTIAHSPCNPNPWPSRVARFDSTGSRRMNTAEGLQSDRRRPGTRRVGDLRATFQSGRPGRATTEIERRLLGPYQPSCPDPVNRPTCCIARSAAGFARRSVAPVGRPMASQMRIGDRQIFRTNRRNHPGKQPDRFLRLLRIDPNLSPRRSQGDRPLPRSDPARPTPDRRRAGDRARAQAGPSPWTGSGLRIEETRPVAITYERAALIGAEPRGSRSRSTAFARAPATSAFLSPA